MPHMDELAPHRKRKAVMSSNAAPKRPRIDTTPRRCPPRRSPTKLVSPRLADIVDTGIVSSADPGPSSGSLRRATSVLDFNAAYVPPMLPLINRQTLKELELDAIFRNPQLRHDLLFDSNLQFRPRRKREPTERYWNALWAELQSGCTCVSFDRSKRPHPLVCVCAALPNPPPSPTVCRPTPEVYTIRMPSRIPQLLQEFLQVLLLVIQPLSSISGVYLHANSIREQMEEHAAQAAYIRTIFDPALIEQELKHACFDPAGLFAAIGDTLKRHCAPMRDKAVEEMVRMAQQPGVDAFRAVRACLELLELMKLDIANHQLNQLRPLLVRTSSQFELKIFKNRFGAESSLHCTREWIHNAYDSLVAAKRPISIGKERIAFDAVPKAAQLYTAVLRGIVDIIFDSSPTSSPPSSPVSPQSPLPSTIPETLYLDKSRLSVLSTDASDTTALYMFMLLFRQLTLLESPDSAPLSKIDESDLLALKEEVRNIGPSHLGTCFVPPRDAQGLDPQEHKDVDQRRSAKQDVILQIARRAHELRHRSRGAADLESVAAPDQAVLGVAERWADSHMYRGAPLMSLLHNRMRDVVFDAVLALAFPPRDSPSARWFRGDFLGNIQLPCFFAQTELSLPSTAGMESLEVEIRRLAEKIARLALIHLNAYGSLYETDGFFESRQPGSTPSSPSSAI